MRKDNGNTALLEVPNVASPNGRAKPGSTSSNSRTEPSRISMLLIGMAPGLLLDPMNPETLDNMRTKAKVTIDKDRSREDIAAGKLYKDENGVLVMPTANMLAALNHAGKLVDFDGKRKMATGGSSWIPSFLSFEDEFCPLQIEGVAASPEPKVHWTADQRRGVIPTGGVAVAIVRPKFKVWEVPVSVIFDPTGLPTQPTIDTIRTLFELAGRTSGLGSFRPEKSGPFGKFIVTDWKIEPLG